MLLKWRGTYDVTSVLALGTHSSTPLQNYCNLKVTAYVSLNLLYLATKKFAVFVEPSVDNRHNNLALDFMFSSDTL